MDPKALSANRLARAGDRLVGAAARCWAAHRAKGGAGLSLWLFIYSHSKLNESAAGMKAGVHRTRCCACLRAAAAEP